MFKITPVLQELPLCGCWTVSTFTRRAWEAGGSEGRRILQAKPKERTVQKSSISDTMHMTKVEMKPSPKRPESM